MFLKDKYLASGAFDKFKARLVAGGDQQDKSLYDNLSSPTAATTSVLIVAAIAASEARHVHVMDIGGAFLNAAISPTGVAVHMRLDRIMTDMLTDIDSSYLKHVNSDGTMVVQLDKALYGCVEAAALWYEDLSNKLKANGFTANPYDNCVFNKTNQKSGIQTTIVMHVDDLMITSTSINDIKEFETYMRSAYAEIKVAGGDVINYIGMTFDFKEPGAFNITMENIMNDIIKGWGPTRARPTPAAEDLFDIRG